MTSKLNNEFLLKPSDRLTIFPIEHNDMWGKCIKKLLVLFGHQKN